MKIEEAQKILTLVKDNYQDIATEFSLSRQKELWPEIKELANKVKDGDRVLDLACGNGRLIKALADKKITYLGIDNSPALIAAAQASYPDYQFMVEDMLDLSNLPKESFEYLFCLAALQHIPSQALRIQALKEMKHLISASGQIIISNWNLWSQKKYKRQLFKNYFLKLLGRYQLDAHDLVFPWKNTKGEIKSDRYYHAFTKKELIKLARQADLEVVSFKKDKYNFWLILKKPSRV